MSGITTLDAIHLAFNTLFAQMKTILAISSENIETLESFDDLLAKQKQFLSDTYSKEVDDFNNAVDIVESLNNQVDELKLQLSQSQADVRQMIAARREDESKVQAIKAKYDQVIRQRDAYQADSKELGNVRAEVKRLKNQVDRNKESVEKETSKASRLELQLNSLRSKMLPTQQAVIGCIQLMRYVRDTLMFEGLAPEKTVEFNGDDYHLYRRPAVVSKVFDPVNCDIPVSRQHMYYFRVETNQGYHFDVFPLETGDVAMGKPKKTIPAALKKELIALFSQETLYDGSKARMRSDALTDKLDEIEKTLPALEALKGGLDYQLVTNKVVQAGRVNANKQKRRAA